MGNIVRQTQPEQQGIHAQNFLELIDNRNRTALTQQYRFATEGIFERAQGGLSLRTGGRNKIRFGAVAGFNFESYSFRAKFFYLSANQFDDAFWFLIGDEAR